LKDCFDFCRRHDLYMLSDETYDELIFEGEHFSPAQWDDEGRVISVFTVSKTYSMTGWRVGYAVASENVITMMSKVQEPIVSCVTTVAQYAAIAALEGCQDCVGEMREHYRLRRDLAVRIARENGLQVSYPHGAFYLLIYIGGQKLGSLPFAQGLLTAEHVAVGPGCAFGDLCDRYIRISLCASEADLCEGITRIARHLQRVSQPELCLVQKV
jgi:aspartate/methionine/tyrosine aminotransferase